MTRIVITPPGRLGLPVSRELWEAREVPYRFAVRDVVLRYRQTAVGVAWVIIQPLAAAGIFTVIFGKVAKLPSDGVPYLLFTMAGMLGWGVFNGIVTRGAPSLVANASLVSKVFFPRILVPLSVVMSVLLDFAVGFLLFVVLLAVFGVNPGWPLLALPIWLLLTSLLAAGIGLAASAMTVKYRDINYALPWVMQILLYATPIAYALSAVPQHLRWLFDINPLSWMMECYRWSMLGLAAPSVWQIVGFAVVAPVVLVGGTLVFQKMERGFADVI